MKPLLILAALASLGAAPLAQAQPVTPATPTSQQISAASPQERLNLLAGFGRLGAFSGDMTVFNRLSTAPSDPGAPFRDLARADQRLAAALIGQSLQFTSVSGQRGVTAWFNPLEDVWVVGLWSPLGEGWRLESLGVLTSDDIERAEGPWNARRPTLAGALAAQADRARDLFRDAIAPGRLDALIGDQARTRTRLAAILPVVRFQYERLAATARLEGYQGWPADLERVFVADTGRLHGDDALRSAIQGLPTRTRLTLEPVMGFSRPDGESVAVQSPFAPALIFIVHFQQSSPGAAAHPVRIEAVDLFSGAA